MSKKDLEPNDAVDVNRADWSDLCDQLPGVGEVLAKRIVAHREEHGPFRDLTELARVRGMGERRAQRLSKRVSLPPPRAEADDGYEGPSPFSSSLAPVGLFDLPPPRISFADELPPSLGASTPPGGPSELESERRRVVGASDVPPAEPPAPHASVDSSRPSVPEAQPRSRRARRGLWQSAAIAALALGAGVGGAWWGAKRAPVESVAQVATEVQTVKGDVDGLKEQVEALTSATARTEQRFDEQEALSLAFDARLARQEREAEELAKQTSAASDRARRAEEKGDAAAARIAKVEDDVTWHRMVTDSKIEALRQRVRQAADELEAVAPRRRSRVANADDPYPD